jgi:hypothetical protein
VVKVEQVQSVVQVVQVVEEEQLVVHQILLVGQETLPQLVHHKDFQEAQEEVVQVHKEMFLVEVVVLQKQVKMVVLHQQHQVEVVQEHQQVFQHHQLLMLVAVAEVEDHQMERCNGAASPCGTGGLANAGDNAAQPTRNGLANRGGGGAGGVCSGSCAGSGGSGVVIIRYKFQ